LISLQLFSKLIRSIDYHIPHSNDNLFPDNNVDNKVVLDNNILSQTNDVNTELSRPHESNDNNNS
ncbi:hypothetical protein KSF78_0006760, partial [Schistosoma japonicum]